MQMVRTGALLACLPLLALPGAAAAADPAIGIELNKLEAVETGCRLWIVIANPTKEPLAKLVVELVSFDAQGVIGQRVAIDLAPVRAQKTVVRPFDLPGEGCAGVARLLLNDAPECAPVPAGGDCLERLTPSSRAGVAFLK
jgi:hypothetical protein